MLARLEDRLDAAVYCPTCGWRRWVGLIFDQWFAACSNCHGLDALE